MTQEANAMIRIGLTAPIGCGKSYVAKLFAEKGIPTVDTDEVYHALVSKPSPLVDKLAEEFGNGILDTNGALDRKKLAPIVFSDSAKLEALNRITHSAVIGETERIIASLEQNGVKAVTVQVPLMFESGYNKMCDTVVCVVADIPIRVSRICKRDGCTEEIAKNRIKNQKEIEFYIANSDEKVYNNGYENIEEQILPILGKLSLL